MRLHRVLTVVLWLPVWSGDEHGLWRPAVFLSPENHFFTFCVEFCNLHREETVSFAIKCIECIRQRNPQSSVTVLIIKTQKQITFWLIWLNASYINRLWTCKIILALMVECVLSLVSHQWVTHPFLHFSPQSGALSTIHLYQIRQSPSSQYMGLIKLCFQKRVMPQQW